jgi:hypothetical protein
VVSGNGLWFFWEDGGVADIYYRWRTEQWQNLPSPVYVSSDANSILPRVVVNSFEPEKIYIAWAEQTGSTYNIYASAYYGEWQSPTVISSTPIWSIAPDIAYVPSGMIEGRLLVVYVEGNERWLGRGGYLPLYRVCTYQSVLPLTPGGGPQSYSDEKLNSRNLLILQPNPFKQVLEIKLRSNSETKKGAVLTIYDISGRVVKKFKDLTKNQSIYWNAEDENGKPLPQGVYFVKLDVGDETITTKAVLLR